jgi:hypothetical protein
MILVFIIFLVFILFLVLITFWTHFKRTQREKINSPIRIPKIKYDFIDENKDKLFNYSFSSFNKYKFNQS